MTNLANYATAKNQTRDVVCAYASAAYQPTPFSSDAPWVVFGGFSVPVAVKVRLCVAGFNQGPAILSVAVFGPGLVDNSTMTITTTTEDETLGLPINLVPGVIYQIAAQYLGASGVATIRTTSLRPL